VYTCRVFGSNSEANLNSVRWARYRKFLMAKQSAPMPLQSEPIVMSFLRLWSRAA
jgi:hypothetical protein